MDKVLLDVEVGASDELPLIIRQSFKGGRYSPSISMAEGVENKGQSHKY
jgi:hypothetical protein